MSNIVRVSSVSEAIELAEKWKQQGKFDLFRGQTAYNICDLVT
jgi:hypothetical protein